MFFSFFLFSFETLKTDQEKTKQKLLAVLNSFHVKRCTTILINKKSVIIYFSHHREYIRTEYYNSVSLNSKKFQNSNNYIGDQALLLVERGLVT